MTTVPRLYISRVVARALKGGDLDVALTRAAVIHGENWDRKSAILDAIRLGLVGYLPELGNKPGLTFGLASGPELYIRLEFSNGELLERTFRAKGDGVSSSVNCSPGIAALVKERAAVLTVMLNAEEYFALGDKDRERYVFANVAIAGMPSDDDLVNETANAIGTASKDFPDYSIREAIGRVAQWGVRDYRVNGKKTAKPETPQERLAAIIDEVRDDFRTFDRHEATMIETARGLAHLRSIDEAVVDVGALEGRRAQIAREVANLTEEKARLSAAYESMKKDRARREEIGRELAAEAQTRARLESIEKEIATHEQMLAGLGAVGAADLDAAVAKVGSLKLAYSRATDALRVAQEADQKALNEVHALEGQTVCPYCKNCGDGWQALRRAELDAALASAKAAISAAVNERKEIEEAGKAAAAEVENLRARRKLWDDTNSALRDAQTAKFRVAGAIARLDDLRAELGRLTQDDPNLTAKVETIQSQLNVLNEEARGLDTKIRDAGVRAADLVRLAQAEKDRDEAAARKLQVAAAGKKLDEIREELVRKAFEPLLRTANSIFGGILSSPLAFRDGEIGTWRGAQWVGHKTFSGGEKALAYAAIQAALASTSPVRVMLLDELGRFTSKNATAVANATLAAIDRGEIDQFVGIDPERRAPYDLGRGVSEFSFQHVAVG